MPRRTVRALVVPCAQLAAFVGLALLPAQGFGPAPDFTLTAIDGTTHTLRDLRGNVVVLEWTSDRCPAVDAAHESGLVAATQKAANGERVRWLRIDSTPGAAEARTEITAWSRQRQRTEPYLLDGDGTVGKAFGARTTPHVFVLDADGSIAYAGGFGDAMQHPVADAIVALDRGVVPWPGRSAPTGSVIRYTGGSAGEHFEQAADEARGGRTDAALAALARAFTAGFATPSEVLSYRAFTPLRRDPGKRAKLRALLRQHAREACQVLVDGDERGEPLRVHGTVRDAAGKPLAGAMLVLWHTGADGLYAEPGHTSDNSRLFAFLRTDAEGRYEYRTIRPGSYPEAESAQHVHVGVLVKGRAPLDDTLVFDDDDKHHGHPPANAGRVHRGADGLATVTHDLTVR